MTQCGGFSCFASLQASTISAHSAFFGFMLEALLGLCIAAIAKTTQALLFLCFNLQAKTLLSAVQMNVLIMEAWEHILRV